MGRSVERKKQDKRQRSSTDVGSLRTRLGTATTLPHPFYERFCLRATVPPGALRISILPAQVQFSQEGLGAPFSRDTSGKFAMIALFPNCAFLSETTRMLEIAEALQERGCEVAVASHGGSYEHILDASPLPWTRLSPVMNEDRATRYVETIVNAGLTVESLLPKTFMREAVVAEAEFLRDTDADMVVIGFTLTAFLSSRVAGVPLATSHGGSYVPPVFERTLVPAPVNPPVAALGWLPAFLRRRFVNVLPPRWKQPVSSLNEMADGFGVEHVPSVAALMCGDLTLVTEIPEVLGIPQKELEAWRPTSSHYRPGTRLRYVGPMYARLDGPIPPEVKAFLDTPEPIVYVAPTSVTRDFLAGLVRAVQRAGMRTLVASTRHDIAELEGNRTCVADVLPNHRVMPEVDVVVIMGGQGSVQCAMASGTPILGFPHHPEQELNLALAERQGMARRLPPKGASTPRLTRAVRDMASDPEAKHNANRVRALYEGVDGAAQAAGAIVQSVGT